MVKSVVFIGLLEYNNLGIGYLSAVLREHGFKTIAIDIRKPKWQILRAIRKYDPVIIGFSLIYLHNLRRFLSLIEYLRLKGVNNHFTAGGHYSSFKYRELFDNVPSLDSVVRFEGEKTIIELIQHLAHGTDWKEIAGIAFRSDTVIVSNRQRTFEKELDIFPFPYRTKLETYAFRKKFTTLIASRGCRYNCSFCNTGAFYKEGTRSIKRVRHPEMVVKEMEMLYNEKNCEIFLFMDDDFPVKDPANLNWISTFCSQLQDSQINDKILWKINCRPDEIEESLFLKMKKNGLFSVFLGLEDGTDTGLKMMNKKISVNTGLEAVRVLKKLKIRLDFGFMLFHPYTTFSSLNENLEFLDSLCSDGYTPVTFLKMLPFYETRIERDLINENRLIDKEEMPDYDFTDIRMDIYYSYISECINEWLYSPDGLHNRASWSCNYIAVYRRFFRVTPRGRQLAYRIHQIIAESNRFLLSTLKEFAVYFENKIYENDESKTYLDNCKKYISECHLYYRSLIINSTAKLISHVNDYEYRQYLSTLN